MGTEPKPTHIPHEFFVQILNKYDEIQKGVCAGLRASASLQTACCLYLKFPIKCCMGFLEALGTFCLSPDKSQCWASVLILRQGMDAVGGHAGHLLLSYQTRKFQMTLNMASSTHQNCGAT
eukprot:1141790-Pelagomonas_calceolata.AAC.1